MDLTLYSHDTHKKTECHCLLKDYLQVLSTKKRDYQDKILGLKIDLFFIKTRK